MPPCASRSRTRCTGRRLCRIPRTRPCSTEYLCSSSNPMNRQFQAFVVVVLLALAVPCARGEFVVEITRGQADAIPIAIVPFSSAEAAKDSFDVAQLASDDLERS